MNAPYHFILEIWLKFLPKVHPAREEIITVVGVNNVSKALCK